MRRLNVISDLSVQEHTPEADTFWRQLPGHDLWVWESGDSVRAVSGHTMRKCRAADLLPNPWGPLSSPKSEWRTLDGT